MSQSNLPCAVWENICFQIWTDVRALTSISQVSSQFLIYTAPALLLDMPIDPRALGDLIDYQPPEARVQRILRRAANDMIVMDGGVFEDLVRIQLCFNHMRVNALSWTLRGGLGDMRLENVIMILLQVIQGCPLLRRWVTIGLDEMFSWVQQGMNLTAEEIGMDLSCVIPQLQRNWRQEPVNCICLANLISVLKISAGEVGLLRREMQ
jgi:hypothetical protein